MGDVDDARPRLDVEDHRVTNADELVCPAVVGQERDERGTISHPVDVIPRLPVSGQPAWV